MRALYTQEVQVAVPASAISPELAYIGKHLGDALGVGEMSMVQVSFLARDVTREQVAEMLQMDWEKICSRLRSGPQAVTVKVVDIPWAGGCL